MDGLDSWSEFLRHAAYVFPNDKIRMMFTRCIDLVHFGLFRKLKMSNEEVIIETSHLRSILLTIVPMSMGKPHNELDRLENKNHIVDFYLIGLGLYMKSFGKIANTVETDVWKLSLVSGTESNPEPTP